MSKKYLDKYIKVFSKMSLYDKKADGCLNIHTGAEFDSFIDNVYSDIASLNEQELINVIGSIIKKTKEMNIFVYGVIESIINIHFEKNPNLHPIKKLTNFLKEVMKNIKDENPIRRDFYLFLMQYKNTDTKK